MKVELELNIIGDGRIFLNYWNYVNGNDVVAEVRKGELYIPSYDKESGKWFEKKIALQEFIDEVKKRQI